MDIKKRKNYRLIHLLGIIGILLLGTFTPLLSTQKVAADENNYELTIVKYKLSEKDLNAGILPDEPLGSDAQLSNQSLEPLAGISYRVVKVIPSNNEKDPFIEVEGFEPVTVTTDASGKATVPLPEGLYEVTELANEQLVSPAQPVVVQLPMTTKEGNRLEHLFIYPKSSVIVPPGGDGKTPPKKDNPTPPGKTSPGGDTKGNTSPTRIPQTSGNIGSILPVYAALGVIILIGFVGAFGGPRKRNN